MAITNRIKFFGKKDGKPLTVIWENGEFNTSYRHELSEYVDRPIGGTYFPEKDDPLGAVSAAWWFFDNHRYTLEPNGEMPKLPYKEGVIY